MLFALQLAHDERCPETGNHVAKVIHSFGRAERVDRAALARLVSSLSPFLTPEEAVAAATGMDVEVVDSRRLGGTWTLDQVWERLGIGAAIGKCTPTRVRPTTNRRVVCASRSGTTSGCPSGHRSRAAARAAVEMPPLPPTRLSSRSMRPPLA